MHPYVGGAHAAAHLCSVLSVCCKLTGRSSHSWGEAGVFLNFAKHDSGFFFIHLEGKLISLESGIVILFLVSSLILTSEAAFSGGTLTQSNLPHKPHPQE